jgi:hypothetical protein
MILTFIIAAILFAFLLFTEKKLVRRQWLMLFLFGFVLTFLVSFFSVWSAWNPYTLSDYLHAGSYSGVSGLSYPLWMSVYVSPMAERWIIPGYDHVLSSIGGNVSFDVFIANEKVLETNGTLSYAMVYGPAPVGYQLGPPFYSDAVYFFGFLLLLFFLFDMAGFALGISLTYVVSRKLATQKHAAAKETSPEVH